MKLLISVTLLALGAGLAVAQYSDGPVPQRLNIPGAVLRPQQPGAFRSGPVLVRTRRPIKGRLQHASPPLPAIASTPSPVLDAKPVTEEIEEPTDAAQGPFVPRLIGGSSAAPEAPQQHFSLAPVAARAPQPKQPKFFEPNPSLGEDDGPIVARFQPQERPTAVPVQAVRYQQAPQKAFRPPVQEREREVVRPTPRYNNHNENRERKPVAQILRKYREEHEDGTITWGFENDDGSFKEETIGIDCITRGRYGYVDPDGEKREYTYETGIQCDPNKRDEEEPEEELEQEFAPHVKHFKRPQFKNQN